MEQLTTDELNSDDRPLTDKALDAFWAVVAEHYPQARTGDLSPGTTLCLLNAAENAIKEWVDSNVKGGHWNGTGRRSGGPRRLVWCQLFGLVRWAIKRLTP